MNGLKMDQHRNGQPDRAQRGSNLVELALIMPLLLLLLAAIADFGRAFNSYIIITNAAREGARFGARIDDHTEAVDQYILGAVTQEATNSGVDLTKAEFATITIEPLWADRWPAYEAMTVTVEYSMTTIFTGLVGLDVIPMRSRSVMVMFGSIPPTPLP